jgi:hypothetical protein
MLTSSRKSVVPADAPFLSFLLVFARTTAMILSGTITFTTAFRWNKHQPVYPYKSFSSLTMIAVGIFFGWYLSVSVQLPWTLVSPESLKTTAKKMAQSSNNTVPKGKRKK